MPTSGKPERCDPAARDVRQPTTRRDTEPTSRSLLLATKTAPWKTPESPQKSPQQKSIRMVKEAGLKSFPTPAGGPRQTRAYSVRVDKDGNELHHNFADRSKIKWASTNEGRPLCWVYAVDDQNVRSHDPINVTDAKALEASVAHLAAAAGDGVFAPASGARGVAERVTFVVQKGEPAAWDDVLRTVATPASPATPDRRPYF